MSTFFANKDEPTESGQSDTLQFIRGCRDLGPDNLAPTDHVNMLVDSEFSEFMSTLNRYRQLVVHFATSLPGPAPGDRQMVRNPNDAFAIHTTPEPMMPATLTSAAGLEMDTQTNNSNYCNDIEKTRLVVNLIRQLPKSLQQKWLDAFNLDGSALES